MCLRVHSCHVDRSPCWRSGNAADTPASWPFLSRCGLGSIVRAQLPLAVLPTPRGRGGALFSCAPLHDRVSVPMLGERVGVHRWCAVSVGFMGILFMARPSGEAF